MKKKRKHILRLGLFLLVFTGFVCFISTVYAQEAKYPSKPISAIVNFPPGGPIDIPARILVNDLSKELGVPITIEYKAGAGGMIGASYVATSKADGYTLLITSVSSIVSAPFLEKDTAPYDPLKDFTPIASFAIIPNVLATYGSSNLNTFEDVIKAAKDAPGKLTCSTPGAGTTAHFILEVLKMHNINITPVPAKGGAPAAISVLGKHVDMGVFLYSAAVPHIKSGGLKLLAATNRIEQAPKVPTLKEKGYPEATSLGSTVGVIGPKNLPKNIQETVANAVNKVIQIASVKKSLQDAGYTLSYLGPDGLTKDFIEDCKGSGHWKIR